MELPLSVTSSPAVNLGPTQLVPEKKKKQFTQTEHHAFTQSKNLFIVFGRWSLVDKNTQTKQDGDRNRYSKSGRSALKLCYLKISAALRRKSCSCWWLSELIPLSMMVSRGSTKPKTRGLPACRATNTSIRSNTYSMWKSQTKEGDNFRVGGKCIFTVLM